MAFVMHYNFRYLWFLVEYRIKEMESEAYGIRKLVEM